MARDGRIWRVAANRELRLDASRLMGILNVTPDSFSDGGAFASPEPAYEHGRRMIDEGAAVIDIGGESTRPGAERVDSDEQIRRVCPVIERLRAASDVIITVDTTRADVARAALDAGAHAINDVAAGLEDDAMFDLAASRGCGLILMHRMLPPEEDAYSDTYTAPPIEGDVVREVRSFLVERASRAIGAGVPPTSIMLDPGLGFGKTVRQNYELMARGTELLAIGRPLLWGVSRKSFIGRVTGVETPKARLAGSLAAMSLLASAQSALFRVHDVGPHREALAVVRAIRYSPEEA